MIKTHQNQFPLTILINSRRFSGYIYKEDNVYEDRDINDYISENATYATS